jgi:hypothetical protein
MIQDYTIFTTYILSGGTTGATGHGNSVPIHCNYIRSINIETDNFTTQEIIMNFSGGTTGSTAPFKFLSNNVAVGTGFTANQIFALVQSAITTTNTVPDPSKWLKYDLTPQITPAHAYGTPLNAGELMNNIFKVPIGKMNGTGFTSYNLTYLSYPPVSGTSLSFGDEIYFLGNVTTEIHADVFVTDLAITLNLNDYISSTNPTWLALSPRPAVAITEIGIYDANKNLVAIGKLNDPIIKDSSITRTIVFDIDF